jgi:hypothetical protein
MEEEYQPDSDSGSQEVSTGRRRLITYLLGFSVVATLGGVLTPVVGYLWPPKRASAGGSGRVQAGTTVDFPVGQRLAEAVASRQVQLSTSPSVKVRWCR